jgi:hypothetical protein
MPTTCRGGCRCGAIRYEVTTDPMFAGQCQCRDCQHETGGGHSSFLAFPADAVRLGGTPRFYEVKTDSGNTMRRGLCPTCGSPVIADTSGMSDVTAVSAGSLDDPSLFRPQFVCYTSRGHAWDLVDPAVPSFPKMPAMAGGGEQPRST